ncbi:MAG: hypothetical protein GF364_14435 [Candidatus Lokiarchaeota archaeon]|nr:hypothetical protein [Candidatus Lokiarchaeota archaeon]
MKPKDDFKKFFAALKNPKIQIKLLNTNMDIRYKKQPKLRDLIKDIYSRIYKTIELVNSEEIDAHNELLSKTQKKRWNRHLIHPLIDQKKIIDTRIVCFGVGGIGSNILLGLSYSGVSNYKIIDSDTIELSNLNRQTFYNPKHIGESKVKRAEKTMKLINPDINIKSFDMQINYPKNIEILEMDEKDYPENIKKIDKLIKWGDYIINAVDYLGSPYLINDLCIKNKKPYYWGVVDSFMGKIFSYYPDKKHACLRCLFDSEGIHKDEIYLRYKEFNEDTPKNPNSGIIAINTGVLMANMIINNICKINDETSNKFLVFDAMRMQLFKIQMIIDNTCLCQKIN